VGGVSAAVVSSGDGGRSELAEAFSAVRARVALVAILLALAALAWWLTAARMAGMDAAPGTDLGALGWFLEVWVVMMAVMMLPSLAATVALQWRMTAGTTGPGCCCSPAATCSWSPRSTSCRR
jgi:hypothetical protein